MDLLEQEVQIGEGPAVAATGLSPDKRMLVVQRSPLHLQCLLLPSANMFLQASDIAMQWPPVGRPHSCRNFLEGLNLGPCRCDSQAL